MRQCGVRRLEERPAALCSPWQVFLHGCTLYSVVGLEPSAGLPEAGRDEASLGCSNTTSAAALAINTRGFFKDKRHSVPRGPLAFKQPPSHPTALGTAFN